MNREVLSIPERQSRTPQIELVSGIHCVTSRQYGEVHNRVLAGDTSVSYWNPAVGTRLRQINPSLVTVDSSPSISGGPNSHSRLWLPGNPSDISDHATMNVLFGDVLYKGFMFPDGDIRNLDTNSIEYRIFRDLGKFENSAVQECIAKAFGESGATVLGGLGLIHAALQDKSQPASLIKGVVGAGLLGLAVARSVPVLDTYSTNTNLSKKLQTLTHLTRPHVFKSKWLDGRTAILISKTLNAMDELKLGDKEKAAIVMGFPHMYEAKNLLQNTRKRQSTIHAYARDMADKVGRLVHSYKDDLFRDDRDEQYFLDFLMTYIAMGDIVEVSDLPKNTPTTYEDIAASRKTVKKYIGSEVAEVVKDIGDPYRLFEGIT
jgi:hypothetical protein